MWASNIKHTCDYDTRQYQNIKKYGIVFCRLTPVQKDAIAILVTQSHYYFHIYAKYRTKEQKQELCQPHYFDALTELYFGKTPTRYLLSRYTNSYDFSSLPAFKIADFTLSSKGFLALF